jgi:predicted CoA-binding protein
MAEADLEIAEEIEHRYDYEPAHLAEILGSVKTIAMVGASADKTKFSYGVLRQMNEIGYEILPVTSNPLTTEIRGLKVYRSLQDIDRPIDMVDVFRPKEEFYGMAEQAIAVGAKVLWGQIGVYDDDAAALAEAAGLQIVMDRCPKIELFRPFWKPRLDLELNLPEKPGATRSTQNSGSPQ